jgi:hypothetical protein
MFNNILQEIRQKIRNQAYIMTLHAEEEMSDDNLSIFDIEQGILRGRILERQIDRISSESKHRIRGRTSDNDAVEIIVKLSLTGKVVIITVYLL